MNSGLRKLALVISMLILSVAASGCGSGSAKSPEALKVNDQASQVAEAPQTGDAIHRNTPQERQLLQTVGALTAAHCYQTYLNIGFIADGKAKGSYTNQDANKVLDSILSLLNSVDRNLAAVGKIDLDKQDRESLEQMRDLSALLRQQGKELQAYWDSGKDEDAARFDNTRKDSWAAINKLTGIGR